MTPKKLALRYMAILFGGEGLDRLEALLAEDFLFEGPLYSFDSAADYIAALKAAPPSGFRYELIDLYEKDGSALLLYRFIKPGVTTLMAQQFVVKEEKISRIRLIFDSLPFVEKSHE